MSRSAVSFRSPVSLRLRRALGLLAVAYLAGTLACCSHGGQARSAKAPEGGAAKDVRADDASKPAPVITYEKTGGIAGFRLQLTVNPGGAWVAKDLARNKQAEGTFEPAAYDSLLAAIGAVPSGDWGRFSSDVVDDFHYRLTVTRGDVVRTLESAGMVLPKTWRPVLDVLERPWPVLFGVQ